MWERGEKAQPCLKMPESVCRDGDADDLYSSPQILQRNVDKGGAISGSKFFKAFTNVGTRDTLARAWLHLQCNHSELYSLHGGASQRESKVTARPPSRHNQ